MRQTEILVAVRISKSSGRDLLTGIFRFFEENPAWQLHLVQYDEDFTPEIVRGAPERGFSGIIATIPGADGTVEALVESPLPVVFMNFADCSLSRRRGPTAFIRADNTAAGRLAASALIKSGSRESYAYVPKTDEWWCAERGRGFAEVLAKNGKKCQTFVSVARPSAPFEDHEGLAAFVAGLPKPAAVYAATDECALKVLAAARSVGAKIPEQMALVSTDNDEFLVRHSNPPLSSVFMGNARSGFRAAQEMKRLLAGKDSPRNVILIPPLGVIERDSTRSAPPATALVRRIKAYIEAHIGERIGVADVARNVGVSRNLAELRFRQIEGSSIRRMIEDCRLAEVKRLLKRTRLSVTEIAARTGFSGQNRLSHVFKARFGQAPEHWRKKRIP